MGGRKKVRGAGPIDRGLLTPSHARAWILTHNAFPQASKKIVKKKRTGLRQVFKCVQCNNDNVVECIMYVVGASRRK